MRSAEGNEAACVTSMLLRVVFLTVIGAGFFLIKSCLMRTNDKDGNMVLENLLPIPIGALAVELLINALRIGERASRAVLCIAFCLLLTTFIRESCRSSEDELSAFDDDGEEPTGGRIG